MQKTPCESILINDRTRAELTGIVSVESFDEFSIVMTVAQGGLTVEGEALSIEILDLEAGRVTATGRIGAVYYTDSVTHKKGGAFHLFRKNT